MKLSPKSKIRHHLFTALIIVLLIVLFIVLNLTTVTKGIRNVFYLISAPAQKALWGAGDNVSDFLETIAKIKNLKRETDELKLKNQELLAENVSLNELKKENKILREALEVGLKEEFKLALAEIIGKDISQDSILINRGLIDGISKDLPVITQEKLLVGKINEVYENFSKVILISNKKSSFDAKISEAEIYGVVKGRGNFKLFLSLVPQEKEIKKGDLVITTVLGRIFPKGLLVGEIKEVKKSDIEPFQEAEIKPAYNVKEIDTLFVITNF